MLINQEKTTKDQMYLVSVFQKYGGKIFQNSFLLALVLLFIDKKNYPTQLKNSLGDTLFWISLCLFFLTLLSYLYSKHFADLFKINSICEMETISFSSLLGISLYSILSKVFLNSYALYKCTLTIGVAIVLLFVIMKRRANYNKILHQIIEKPKNLMDLKDWIKLSHQELKDKYYLEANKMILFDETEVEYDLLKRGYAANQLIEAIKSCNPKKHFVIGLEGDWGSGKSTILKNVTRELKEQNNYGSVPQVLVIDDFEIWRYGSEESIILGFFECLLKGIGIKYNSSELEKNIQSLIDSVVKNPEKSNLLKGFLFQTKNISDIKKEINDFIRFSKKKIVVYIDNLDRISSDKIVFMLKIIANILNFDGIIYILAYEKDKLENALNNELNVDSEYLKKVIQLQFHVPEISFDEKKNIVSEAIKKLFVYYFPQDDNLKKSSITEVEQNEMITAVLDTTDDLRDFKRNINSVFSKLIQTSNALSLKDKFLLYYIRINNPPLYKEIFKNSHYFIINNTIKYRNDCTAFLSGLNSTEEAKNKEDYLVKFFKDYKNTVYDSIVTTLFPNIRDFLDNKEKKEKDFYPDVFHRLGIADGKFFDLYFTEIENQNSKIGKDVRDFLIDLVRKDNVKIEFENLLNKYKTSDEHRILFEFLHLFIRTNQITAEQQTYLLKLYDLLEALFENYGSLDNSIELRKMNAHGRANIIISELISRISFEDFTKFIGSKNKNDWVMHLEILEEVFRRNDLPVKESSCIEHKSKKEKWTEIVEKTLAYIMEKRVNIYSENFYRPWTFHALLRIFMQQYRQRLDEHVYTKNLQSLNDYIYFSFQEEDKYIFKFLWDLVDCEVNGHEYKYYIIPGYISNFYREENKFAEIIDSIKPENTDEEILLELWNIYKSNPEDESGNFKGKFLKEKWIPEFVQRIHFINSSHNKELYSPTS